MIFVGQARALEGAITIPRIGVPTFSLILLEKDLPTAAAITIRVGESLTWWATVKRSGVHGGKASLLAVGGAGGLAATLPPRAYQGVPVRIPLEDLATESGERLSATSSAAPLGIVLPMWVRSQQSATLSLAALLATAGRPAWRILGDGSIWVGEETWPATAMDRYTVNAEGPHRGVIELTSLDPRVFPGETFEGRRISVVEHRVSDRRLLTRIYEEAA